MVGQSELLIIGIIVVILFGAGAIPKIARSIGRAKREFEQGVRDEKTEHEAGNAPDDDNPTQQ